MLLSMVTPLSWLERVPTYKEAFENVKDKDLHTYGFLGYPCLQTADIVIYSAEATALLVPVGEDQVSHVEVSREIVRRFSVFYGLRRELAGLRRRIMQLGGLHDVLGISSRGTAHDPDLFRGEVRRLGRRDWRRQSLTRSWATSRTCFRTHRRSIEPQVMLTKTPADPWARWAQDVQELWQCDHSE